MNEIERLQAELAAAEKEAAEANAYLAAVEAGDKKAKPPKVSKPKAEKKATPKRKRRRVHRSALGTSIEGYGGPAPVGASRIRTSNRPVVTRHVDPMDRPVDDEYEGRECLIIAAAEAGSNMNGIVCRCVDCNN